MSRKILFWEIYQEFYNFNIHDGAPPQGRIQTIPLGGTNFSSSGMYIGWTNEGAKRPRIEGEARTEGEARDIAGEGSGEGARWAPPQKIFENSNLKPFILVHSWSKN